MAKSQPEPEPENVVTGNFEPEPEPTDPFDLAAVRVTDLDEIGTEQLRLTVLVRRPHKHEFFRVHADRAFRDDLWLYTHEREMDRQTYLVVNKAAQAELANEMRAYRLFTCVNARSVVFLWPAIIPRPGIGGYEWHRSALETAGKAESAWVRLQPNRSGGYYECVVATGNLGEPTWPEQAFRDLIKTAFKDHVINSPDHDVLRELRGDC